MEQKKGLSGGVLKQIAILTMFIDHVGVTIVERGIIAGINSTLMGDAIVDSLKAYQFWNMIDKLLRYVGRLAFPIFLFLLIEGLLHTRDWRKYFLRLFVFSLISEIPFDLAVAGRCFYWNYQNVFFTLWIGLLVIVGMKYVEESDRFALYMKYLIEAGIVLAGCIVAKLMHTDYSWKGILILALMFFFRRDKKKQIYAGAIAFLWEITAPLAFIPIARYDGTKGKANKYFFYIFYPAHLLLLGIVVKLCF